MVQAFLEQYKAAHAAVAFLKRVDALKPVVEVQQVYERGGRQAAIFPEQCSYGFPRPLGRCGLRAAYFVGQALVFPHGKPWFGGERGARFQRPVQFFQQAFAERLHGPVDYLVDTPEVVGGLDDVVHSDRLVGNADGVCLEDKAGLVFRQTAPLDVVGVVGEVDLCAMIYAARHPVCLFLPQGSEQRRYFVAGIDSVRQRGVGRYAPCLSDEACPGHLARAAVIPHGSLGQSMGLGIFFRGDISRFRGA